MATCTSNGCCKAVRKGFSDLDCKFRSTPHYLASIDFGTTHCSVAYLLRPDQGSNSSKDDPAILKLEDNNKRVQSCILFDINGEIAAFGSEAREQFRYLDSKLRLQYHYFEHVKLNLQHEKVNVT